MQIKHVTALNRPELAPYATLRQSGEHKSAGIFVAEGDKVVRRLLESDFGVVSVLLPEKRLPEFEPLISARPENVDVYIMELAELSQLTGFPFFQGVLAVGRVPRPPTLESLLTAVTSPRLFVALDGLTNAENVGLIVRNCAAFGVQALLVDGSSASPFLRRSVRNSMGTIFKLPVVGIPTLAPTLTILQAQGFRIIAAHPQQEQRWVGEADFTGDCCVVMGSEGSGLSTSVLAACQEAVAIPMENEVGSLNVGSAAAIFLYEAARQRRTARERPVTD